MYTWSATIGETGTVWTLDKPEDADEAFITGAREAGALIMVDGGGATITKTEAAAPGEPDPEVPAETVDPRTLPVQVILSADKAEITNVYVYQDKTTPDTKVQISEEDIAKSLTIQGIKTVAGKVDFASHSAVTELNTTITWNSDNSIIDTAGKVTVEQSGNNYNLRKVTYPGGVVYLAQVAAASTATGMDLTVTISDKAIKYLVSTDPGYAAINTVPEAVTTPATDKVIKPDADGVVTLGNPTADTTWVRGYAIVKTDWTGSSVAAESDAAPERIVTITGDTKNVAYAMRILAPGSSTPVVFKYDTTGNGSQDVVYIAEGAEIQFVPQTVAAASAAVKGQILTITVNPGAPTAKTYTATVEETGKVPAIGPVKIEGPALAGSTAADINATVSIRFNLSNRPSTAVGQEVYLNDVLVTERDKDGKYILHGVTSEMHVVKADANKDILASKADLTGTGVVKDSTLADVQDRDQIARYTWADADKIAKDPMKTDEPDKVYLYTAYEVKGTFTNTGTASRSLERDIDGSVAGVGDNMFESATTQWFKTETDKVMYVEAANNGEQIWLRPGTASETNPGSIATITAIKNAGEDLSASTKGIWAIEVNRSFVAADIKVAYTAGEVTATYAENKLIFGASKDADRKVTVTTTTDSKVVSAKDNILTGVGTTGTGIRPSIEVKEVGGSTYRLSVVDGLLYIDCLDTSIKTGDDVKNPTFNVELEFVGGWRTAVAIEAA